MFCLILYYLYNLKNLKNTHLGVLLLVLKVTLLHWWFSRFLNSTNGTKSRKESHMFSGRWKVVSISEFVFVDVLDESKNVKVFIELICFRDKYGFSLSSNYNWGKREFSTMRWFNPAGNYTFKVNSKNTRTKRWNMFKVKNKDVCPVSLLLTLNVFYTLF